MGCLFLETQVNTYYTYYPFQYNHYLHNSTLAVDINIINIIDRIWTKWEDVQSLCGDMVPSKEEVLVFTEFVNQFSPEIKG